MNRRAFSLLALLPFMQTRIGGPNPGDCVEPYLQPEASIAAELLRSKLTRWCLTVAQGGVATAYLTLDPRHANLLPSPPLVVVAGVRVFVQVADAPLPPHPIAGEMAWLLVAECGQTV